MFEDGHVDVAVFQPTYLKEWYTTGFNTAEMDAEMAARHPDKLIVNGRFDPRDGDPGLRQLEEDHAKFGHKGVKLYTAQWNSGSRGYKLDSPICEPFFEKCIELGDQEHPRPQGPDDLAAGQGRLRRRRRRQGRDPLPGPQLHR